MFHGIEKQNVIKSIDKEYVIEFTISTQRHEIKINIDDFTQKHVNVSS